MTRSVHPISRRSGISGSTRQRMQPLNWAGDSHDTYSVIIDSALGLLGAAPKDNEEFLAEVRWLEDYLSAKPAPKFPLPLDEVKVRAGNAVFDRECASCHASERTGHAHAAGRRGYGCRTLIHLEKGARDRSESRRERVRHRTPGSRGSRLDRLQRGIPRWVVAARTVLAQRLGAYAARLAQSSRDVARQCSGVVTMFTMPRTSGSSATVTRRSRQERDSTRLCDRMAMVAMCSGRRCPTPTRTC